jgi:tetratricopeptide (TPR) repeat protein
VVKFAPLAAGHASKRGA